MKEELLNSSCESDTVEEQEFNIHNIIDQGEAIDIIKYYADIIKARNKETIRYEAITVAYIWHVSVFFLAEKFRIFALMAGEFCMLVVITGEFRMSAVITGEICKLAAIITKFWTFGTTK